MQFDLEKEPKKPTIIEGFPGFGFVSTIATEFLIKHLKAEKIGKITSSKLSPIAAIHDGEIIDPLEVYYDKKHNLIILRALTDISGAEWNLAGMVLELSKKLDAEKIISIEGIASEKMEDSQVFFYTNSDKGKFKNIKVNELKKGMVAGVTGALILSSEKENFPLSCIFVEANPSLPDSKAAGEVVKVLDSYLKLKVDYKPLIKTGKEFEEKLKKLMQRAKKSSDMKEKKKTSYLG